MNKFQKNLFAIFGAFFIVNLYYSVDFIDSSKILNPSPWTSFADNEHWVKNDNIELKSYLTRVSIFNPNNIFGQTYDVNT